MLPLVLLALSPAADPAADAAVDRALARLAVTSAVKGLAPTRRNYRCESPTCDCTKPTGQGYYACPGQAGYREPGCDCTPAAKPAPNTVRPPKPAARLPVTAPPEWESYGSHSSAPPVWEWKFTPGIGGSFGGWGWVQTGPANQSAPGPAAAPLTYPVPPPARAGCVTDPLTGRTVCPRRN
jgi:hypothetical protein